MDRGLELTRPLPGDIQTTSSLPSSTPPAAAAEDGPSSRPASPAFSTSSTADEGGSSPLLPPLPQPTINGHTLEVRTPPSESRTASSHYYTASWGSPYQQPVASTTRTRSYNHSLSSELSEDSPIRHLEFHTPYLRPAPGFIRSHTEPEFVSQDGLISAAVLANRARRRPNGLTEDWIRQHTGGEDREANNWLSDDPGESEHSSLSGSISDHANWDLDQRTPTLKRFLQSRDPRASRHRRQQTTDTLRQEDFLDFEVPRMSLNSNILRPEEMGPASSHEDMPPPPPPKEEWRAAMLPRPAAAPEPIVAPALTPVRTKKKVPWKGKNILVLLPWDEDRGQRGKAPTPMSEKDVNAMLKEWEQLGYDTTGFNLGPGSDDEGNGAKGQSRSSWPKRDDMLQEREQRSFRVSIPDRREWDAYVRELSEAKLRALGVSFGDEEPVPQPAVSSNASRRTSMQYPPLPFSPPIPTNSAASSHVPNPFSPPLMPGAGLSTNQSSNPGSIASPASLQAHLQGKYNPRQSVSFSGSEHPFGSPFQYPQQTNSPGVWSPQQMLNLQGVPRGGSPALQNLGSMISPASPFTPDGYFPQNGDVLSQMQQRQHLLQNQLALQQQLQMHGAMASPRLQEVREIPDEEDNTISKSPSKTPEARQIKHNPSASLQKEIDDAEYHLEEQMQRQLEHDDYSPHSEKEDDRFSDNSTPETEAKLPTNGLATSRFATVEPEDGPVLHHPQPHSRGHSLSQKPFHDSEESAPESKNGLLGVDKLATAEQSDLETNPSNLGTPVPSNDFSGSAHERALSVSSNPWADSEPNHTEGSSGPRRGHSAKASMSTLNVGAKEFKLNHSSTFPSSTFTPPSIFSPSQFSFGANSFQPPNIAAYSNFTQPMSATSSHFSNPSITSSKGKINVAAPSFQPGNNEFSFSSSGPSFRPDAPVFTPSFNSNFSSSVGSGGSGSEGPRTSIFGNIDLSSVGISKPSKKSKAVPIIRPDSSHSKNVEDENTEDKDGRITQGESRIKRIRGSNTDGDSVPLFAESMPLGETTRDQSPPKETLAVASIPADKENSAPPPEEDDERTPEPPTKSHSRNLSAFSNPPEQANNFAPWEFQEKKQAEDFNAARPFTSRRYGSGLPAYGFHAASDDEDNESVPTQEPVKKGHGRNPSSLSATAKPFEFKPSNFSHTFEKPEPTPAPRELTPPPAPKEEPLPKLKVGLSASRFARSPTPPAKSPTPPAREDTPPAVAMSPEVSFDADESASFQAALPQPQSPPTFEIDHEHDVVEREPTFEEIDAVMRQLNEAELESAPGRELDTPGWHEPIPARHITMPDMDASSPIRLLPQNLMRSDAPSPSPRRFYPVPGETRIFTRMNEDPFIGESPQQENFDAPIHNLNNMHSGPPSEWNDDFSENEDAKLQPRAQFFDNHVNSLVGGLLTERLDPLERTLENIQMSLDMMAARSPSRRRERRSVSGALSDADDEDDDNPRRSMSPRRNRKMDQIRAVVTEAMNASRPQTATNSLLPDSRNVLQALEEMKEQFGQSMRLDFRAEDLRNIVEEAVEKRMPPSPKPFVDETAAAREVEHKSRIADLEEKLLHANNQSSTHLTVLDTQAQRFEEKLSRVEDSHSSRVSELEQRLVAAEAKNEEEMKTRRAAEDRLAEVQRLLRISSEEETRLRETLDEREAKHKEILIVSDLKVRNVEEQRSKTAMKIALLEASQGHAQKTQSDLQNRVNISENDLRTARQEIHRWQMEAERALEAARRHNEDAEAANEMNKELRRTIDTLRNQMEESIRVREGMRGKLIGLQEDMAAAARSISEENFRRAKKEQELIARQEVLDAKLQAEARTRERLETEIERLEQGEREGMRAVSELKKVENLIAELRMESHNAKTDALRFQREFEEARESGLSEVKRTKQYMQAQIDSSNNQVNVVREELEHEISTLHREIDQVKLDADTARAKSEMLLEEAENSKKTLLDDLKQTHEDRLEDLHTQHERQLNNTLEDSQRNEQHLLERLSLSSAKTEHLQDRVTHLTEKLEIASEAASAAVTAAKSARSTSTSHSAPKPLARALELPEKISPQALRESIMVLQEQLQSREQTIEELEAQVEKLDPEAGSKIAKRDDEIIWLRELLSVRKSDLLDIVSSLEGGEYDPERVRDAAIRLRANLQMEEQERERALNGGSALGIPTLASLRDAAIASPRVAQAVGPLAAAWGNWRKTRTDSGAGVEGVLSRDRSSSSTPSKNSPGGQSFLSGLLTPPASSARQGTPNTTSGLNKQPTAFGSTGQRFTSAQLANRPGGRNLTPRKVQPMRDGMSGNVPKTPPMLRKASYDDDAEQRGGFEAGDFSDAGFYDDDESPVDDAYGEEIAAMR